MTTLLQSIQTTRRELEYQVVRLERAIARGPVEAERAHLTDLQERYRDAGRMCGILERYQEGRLRRTRTDAKLQTAAFIDDENLAP